MSSRLDQQQIIKAVYDEATTSLKTSLTNVEIAMEVSADDGDSIITKVENHSVSATVANGTATDTVVIGPSNSTLHSEYQLLVRNVGAITATNLKFALQGNPHTSDANLDWFEISSVTVSTLTDGFLTLGTVAGSLARRYRVVVTHAGFSAGSISIHLMHR
jgi:hypothetical protein